MRIGVFSDTHVGRKMPLAIGNLRRKAYQHAFTQAIDVFIKEDVDYVIHGGDLMERRSMKPEDASFVKEELQRLIDQLGQETRIFTVRGNHDGSLENSVLDYISHPLAKYFRVLGDQTLRGKEEKYSGRDVTVAGLGYYPFIRGKLSKEVIEKSLKGDGLRVFIVHNFVEGYHKIPPGTAKHSTIPLSFLKSFPIDLLVCGHFHESLGLTNDGDMFLLTPGATEAVNLADTGPFGVHILDVNSNRAIKDRFIELVPLHHIKSVEVDSKGAVKTLQWYVKEALLKAETFTEQLEENGREGILRIVVKGRTDEDRLDLDWMVDKSVMKHMQKHPLLIYFDLVNNLEKVGENLHAPPISRRKEYLKEAFNPLGELVSDAFSIVEEIDMVLEEEGSQRTGLLIPSKREEYVKKWLELLNRVEVKEKSRTHS